MKKLKVLALAAAAVLALPGAASAADIAVLKAPRAADFYANSGWYYGIGTVATTTNAEVDSAALGSGSVTTVGAGIGPVFGYHSGNATSFRAAELALYWQNLGGSNLASAPKGVVGGVDVNSNFSAAGRVKIGGVGIMSTLGSILPTNLFGGGAPLVTPSTGQHNMPYFSVGFDASAVKASIIGSEAKGWQVVPTFGMGYMSQIMDPTTNRPTGYVTDVSVEYTPAGRGFVVGGDPNVDANLGRKVMAKVSVIK